jgi:hypothetical protein
MTDDELRAHFAGQALAAMSPMISYDHMLRMQHGELGYARKLARACWVLADAMMQEYSDRFRQERNHVHAESAGVARDDAPVGKSSDTG